MSECSCSFDHSIFSKLDVEKCLWRKESLDALKSAGCNVVRDFPPSSPDLNAVEGVWRLLRERIEATEPLAFEDRATFLVRLRRCVTWLNDDKAEHVLTLCTNQKVRAKHVQANSGAKTEW